jgi:hypothetical protein
MREELLAYGYTPIGEVKKSGTMKLRFLPTGKTEYLRMGQIRYRIDTGKLQRVDPRFGRIRVPSGDESWLTSIDGWNDESALVQGLAKEYHEADWKQVMRRRDVFEESGGGEIQDKAKLYAMIACLKRFKFDPEHKAWFIVEAEGVTTYRFINENTIEILEAMLNRAIYTDDEFENMYSDSTNLLIGSMRHWSRIGFGFEKSKVKNPLDHPSEDEPEFVGFFRYINESEDDLGEFGIYKTFDEKNYKVNCLVQSLSHVLRPDEIKFLRSIVQVWHFPLKSMKWIASLFNLEIWIHHESYTEPRIGSRRRKVNLQVFKDGTYFGHLMKYQEGLLERIKSCKLRPMTNEEFNVASRARKAPKLVARRYPDCSFDKTVVKSKKGFNLETWWKGNELREDVFQRFREVMLKMFHVDPRDHSTLAEFAFSLISEKIKGVEEMRGFVKDFIRKCQHPAILGTANKVYPVWIKGGLVQYDQNASYPSTYESFPGIPIGKPSVIKGDFHDVSPAYYVQINVKSFKCRHREDPYPLVSLGIQYMDKIWLEMVEKHYDIDYEFLSGYSFKKVENGIQGITKNLWNLREELKRRDLPVAKIVKTVLNSWWGKSMAKDRPVTEKLIDEKALKNFIQRHPLIYSYRKSDDKVRVRCVKPLMLGYERPQFGVSVLSWSRKIMQEIVYECVDRGIEVLYCNTDSLLVRKGERMDEILKIGSGLGEFKVEVESEEFICLGPKKKAHLLKDGTVKNTFGKSYWEYWIAEYEKNSIQSGE